MNGKKRALSARPPAFIFQKKYLKKKTQHWALPGVSLTLQSPGVIDQKELLPGSYLLAAAPEQLCTTLLSLLQVIASTETFFATIGKKSYSLFIVPLCLTA